MISLLCGMNKHRLELMEQRADAMPDGIITEYDEKYYSILKQGREGNKTTSDKYSKQDEEALLGKMEKYGHSRNSSTR